MKTLYRTPCDVYIKWFKSHYEAVLDILCTHHKCLPDRKYVKNTIQAVFNKLVSLKVTACEIVYGKQFESHYDSVLDMLCTHHKVSP